MLHFVEEECTLNLFWILLNLCLTLLQCDSEHKHYKIHFEAIPLVQWVSTKNIPHHFGAGGIDLCFKFLINNFAFQSFQLLLKQRQKKNVLFLTTCYAKLNFDIYSSISLNCSFPKCQVSIYSQAKDIML